MESALYGIYALVVFVSEILLVRCAHSFDFWYVNNSCVNTVRQHFPWSILYTLNPIQTLVSLMFWVEAIQLFCPCRHFMQSLCSRKYNCLSFQIQLRKLKSFSWRFELFLSQLSCWKGTRCLSNNWLSNPTFCSKIESIRVISTSPHYFSLWTLMVWHFDSFCLIQPIK